MKICLINPPCSDGYLSNMYSMQHIGIAYIASCLEKHGYETDIIECQIQNMNISAVMKQLEEKKYDLIGISVYFYNKSFALKLAIKIKRKLDCFLYIGGYYPTLYREETFRTFYFIDCIVVGEGEMTTIDLAKKLDKGDNWRCIEGISYVEDGKIIDTAPRKLIENLDALPYPKRIVGKNNYMVPIISSRGCYGRCTFCGVKEFYDNCIGKKKRNRSVTDFVSELEELVQLYDPQVIYVSDETFFEASNVRQQWLNELFDLLACKNYNLEYRCQARANDAIYNYEQIKKMVEFGMTHLFVGIESFNQRQLDFFQKDLKVETNIQAIKLLTGLDVYLNIGFIFFDPYITFSEIHENIRLIRETNFCRQTTPEEQIPFSKSVLMLIEGTKVYEELEVKGLLKPNERKYEFINDGVEQAYNILKDCWYPYIDPFYQKMSYISNIRRSKNKGEDIRYIEELKLQFLETDLDVIDYVCTSVECNIEKNEIVQRLDQYGEVIHRLTTELCRIVDKYDYSCK